MRAKLGRASELLLLEPERAVVASHRRDRVIIADTSRESEAIPA
jgi:hypothetical protein